MNALRALLATVGLAALLAAGGAFAHPFHSSYAEIGWSDGGGQLEVALRVIPEDLEAALSRQEADTVVLVQSPPVLRAIETYLQATFQVQGADGRVRPVSLGGFEAGYRETWLYFTVEAADSETLSLRHTVLLDEDITQRNQTRRLWEPGADVLVFTADQPRQTLWAPQPQDSSSTR
ncbi:MAG: hypothetical protein RIC38_11520 [Chromatocurvus sp.]